MTRHLRARVTLGAILLAGITAGCGGDAPPQAAPADEARTSAEARATAVAPADGSQPLVGMMTYLADAAVFAECRSGVTYPVAREDAYADMEQAYLRDRAAPGEPLRVRVRGRLLPRAGEDGSERTSLVVEEFLDSEPGAGCGEERADVPLEGTPWTLAALGGEPVPAGVAATLVLDRAGGRASGSGGCNTFTGTYRLEGASLTFGDLASTARACAGAAMDVEALYLRTLGRVGGYRVLGTDLELLAEEGAVARFRSR